MNSSKYSKRLYRSSDSQPNIMIMDIEGNKKDIIINDMSPLYRAFFFFEDKYSNVYFIFVHYDVTKPRQIWIYNKEMNLIGKIDNFPHNSGFNFLMKERLVDDNGNIYFMHLSKSAGVQIIKWYAK